MPESGTLRRKAVGSSVGAGAAQSVGTASGAISGGPSIWSGAASSSDMSQPLLPRTSAQRADPLRQHHTSPSLLAAAKAAADMPPALSLQNSSTQSSSAQSEAAQAAAEVEAETASIPAGEHVYELLSVMVHSGGATGGHYYAYIKHLRTKRWYRFDDSSVSRASVKDVESAFGTNGLSSNAYMVGAVRGKPNLCCCI